MLGRAPQAVDASRPSDRISGRLPLTPHPRCYQASRTRRPQRRKNCFLKIREGFHHLWLSRTVASLTELPNAMINRTPGSAQPFDTDSQRHAPSKQTPLLGIAGERQLFV
jgi:hypothetical protein